MARTIQKKAISDDLLFADDFDESMLDKIEGDLGQSYARDLPEERTLDFTPDKAKAKNTGGKPGEPYETGETMEPDAFERDLAFSELEDKPDEKAIHEPSDDVNSSDDLKQHEIIKKLRSKKIALLLAATTVLIIIIGGLSYLLWPAPKKNETPRIDIVRHRIVIPVYEQEINFLLFSNNQGKEDLLKLDLELEFASFKAHEKFMQKQVLYTDYIYGFLQKQSPPENSVQHWVKVLEQDLPNHFQNECPEIRLNAIRMKSFYRL